jgi:hypothetical protein
VPKTLLKGFCDQSGVLRVRRRDGQEFLLSLEKASVHRDFYSFPDLDGKLVDDVEDWLDIGVEAPATPILKRAREGLAPEMSDVKALARFVAAGLLRTATTRSYLRQIDANSGPFLLMMQVAKEHGINLATLPELDRDDLLVASTKAWAGVSPGDSVRSYLRTFLRKLDEISTRLAEWSWTLLIATNPCLVTGDAPVATFRAIDGGWRGILPSGSPVFLPVTSRSVLVGDPYRLGNGRLTPDLARLINTSLANEVFGAVFAHPSMDWPEYLRLASTPPMLPVPKVTWSKPRQENAPTFPARYPPTTAADIHELLLTLGAEEVVE